MAAIAGRRMRPKRRRTRASVAFDSKIRDGVMAGHSRSKNGIAPLAYVPASSLRRAQCLPDRDARDKRGHDVKDASGARKVAPPRQAVRDHLLEDAAPDRAVGGRRIAPPPAVLLHGARRGDETVCYGLEVGVRIVEAEDQATGADPAQRQS